ncbi:MAG: tyrosine-type recombinase/integrase [Firmicutes bacterium]|nr:tyrosine-type recombinase/integrase [Bacillota bacterium]
MLSCLRGQASHSIYRAKLQEATPHKLRHTFCKNTIDMSIPINQVAMLAGHSKLDIIARYTLPSAKRSVGGGKDGLGVKY